MSRNRENTQDVSGSAAGLTPNSPLVLVMAIATGAAVANIWYAQPLLDTLGHAFGVSNGTAGLIVALTQLGYAAGLAFLVPLGDLLERRRLITVITLGTVLSLAFAAVAPDVSVFLFASLAIGATSVVAQVLVPLAAHLAAEEQRGRVVGRVMAGLLLGILLARTASGYISDALGWRAVFWAAAGVMLVQAGVLWRMLPRSRGESRLSYGGLLLSVLHLFRDEPLLRRRAVYGTLGMASFSALWTALTFLLANPPYNYSDSLIGLFGLLGVAGALCAMVVGRLHDKGGNRAATGVSLALIAVAFAVMGLFRNHLAAIIAGVVLLDLGQQGEHILNQSLIYQIRPEARSRMTTAYMTCFFAGGVIGSALAASLYGVAGWTSVAWLGGSFGGLAFLYWLTEFRTG
ncbi:MAG: MFS transporter [Gammaproteobacteria bacterium]